MERSTFRLKIMRAGRHSTTPLSAWSGYNNKNRARSSRVMELPEVADNSPRVASEKQHGTESENTYNFPIIDTFGYYVWKAIAPEASNSGPAELGLEVRKVCTIDGNPHPLPVIHTYGEGVSNCNYTCHPNIHNSLLANHDCCEGRWMLTHNGQEQTTNMVALT